MMAAAKLTSAHTLGELLDGFADTSGVADVAIDGISLDSRTVKKGDLFFALAGSKAQGHDFIVHALAADAAAVLWEKSPGVSSLDQTKLGHGRRHTVPVLGVENLRAHLGEIAARFYGDPSATLHMFGVTGTNGKTSCSQFIARALNADAPCGVIGTLGYGIVDKLESSAHTTPDAITVQRVLAELRDAGANSVAMEVSSHALDQGRVNGVHFDCAVFTNLTRDHLDYHNDMESYGAAKARLFHVPGLKRAVINADDEFGRWLLAHVPAQLDVVSYGLAGSPFEPRPALYAERVQLTVDGLQLSVVTPWGNAEISSPLLGRFNASNLLAVLGALCMTGMSFATAVQRIQTLTTVAGRMERYGGHGRPLLVVDYAHTPDALQHVLQALREHTGGQLTCVFGCGGDRDRGKRPLMGRIAEAGADRVIVTDDNPRTEDAQQIVRDIVRGFAHPERAQIVHDRAQAIAQAYRTSGAGDVVLIAGKGHEDYQIIGATKYPFSDAAVVSRLLAEGAQ